MEIEARCTREEYERLCAQLDEEHIEYTTLTKQRTTHWQGISDDHKHETYEVWFWIDENLI